MSKSLEQMTEKATNASTRLDEIAKRLPSDAGASREDLKAVKLELDHLTKSFKV